MIQYHFHALIVTLSKHREGMFQVAQRQNMTDQRVELYRAAADKIDTRRVIFPPGRSCTDD